MQSFTLTRTDGLEYRFVPRNSSGTPAEYIRTDNADLTIGWEPGWGWCARDPGSGRIAGMSLDLPAALQGGQPPRGRWVSAKGETSYVYELRYE
ncbi:MAG: hypothetical protein AAF891_03095 [Pseudomonadota bacterium]